MWAEGVPEIQTYAITHKFKGKYCHILQAALHKNNEEKLRSLAKGKCEE